MSLTAPLVPDPVDADLAEAALRALSDAAAVGDGPVRLHVEEGGDVIVPRSALTALTQILASFAQGDGVTVLPSHAELTTQQAADAMHVSRPYLIGLLESGKIAFRKVGTHRRIPATALVEYMRQDQARRRAIADELSAETHDLGFA